MSKNCLATPAGLDRDYNFISTIEHAVDRAGHEQNDRGIDGKRPGLDSKRQINARGPPLQRALQNADIKVYRAPLGMNRQRENDTKWDTKYDSQVFIPRSNSANDFQAETRALDRRVVPP